MEVSLDEFKNIRRSLKDLRNLNFPGYSRGMLFTILSQKRVDYVKRNYYRYLDKLEELLKYWKTENKLPKWLRLTPVMRVRLLLKSLEFTKAEINRVLNNPERLDDEKLEEVVWKALYTDYVYSPLAVKHQRARGRLGEEIIKQWLNSKDLDYKTEDDLRKVFPKTPDFYFEEPLKLNGFEVRWIESKALFGDPKTHRIYSKKQFSIYKEMFGDGYIIYWFGYVKGVNGKILDVKMFESPLKSALNDMIIYTAGGNSEKVERVAEKLNANIVDVGCDTSQHILKLDLCNDIKNTEFLNCVCSIVDCYSKGRILVADSERNWRNKESVRRKIGQVLRNMGFLVIHLNL